MSDILQIVEVIARQAGAVLMEGYGNVRHIQQKGVIDLVTEFDKRSEEIIISSIQQKFPEHAILAEESGHNKIISEYQWVIDPLDGTTNFAHGIPVFSVSIGLLRNNSPVVGVAYDPLRNEMFSAELGHGATLNNHPIHVSSQTDLGQAVFLPAFHMIFAPTHEIILLNLFNSNCELKRLGTWVLQPLIVHGRQWADWMAIGNLESNHGISEQEHLSCVRRADASHQLMEMKISYQTTLF